MSVSLQWSSDMTSSRGSVSPWKPIPLTGRCHTNTPITAHVNRRFYWMFRCEALPKHPHLSLCLISPTSHLQPFSPIRPLSCPGHFAPVLSLASILSIICPEYGVFVFFTVWLAIDFFPSQAVWELRAGCVLVL